MAKTAVVLSFPFSENYNDVSPNAYATSVVGTPTLAADAANHAKSAVNTSTGGIALDANTGDYKVNFPWTFSANFKMNALGVVNPIFTSEDDQSSYSGIWVQVLSDGRVAANVGNGGTPNSSGRKSAVTDNAVVSAGQWYQVVVVAKSISDFSIYINGNLCASSLSGDATSIVYKNGSGNVAKIGTYNKGTGNTYYFDGSIDELNLWSAELTGTPLTDLLNAGKSVSVFEVEQTNHFRIYPNPASQYIAITVGAQWNTNNSSVAIVDAFGKTVKQESFNGSGINLQDLAPGAYILSLRNEEEILSEKLIIQ